MFYSINLQYESLWVLTNLTSGTKEQTQEVLGMYYDIIFTIILN